MKSLLNLGLILSLAVFSACQGAGSANDFDKPETASKAAIELEPLVSAQDIEDITTGLKNVGIDPVVATKIPNGFKTDVKSVSLMRSDDGNTWIVSAQIELTPSRTYALEFPAQTFAEAKELSDVLKDRSSSVSCAEFSLKGARQSLTCTRISGVRDLTQAQN